MASIKCGKCKASHATVSEVRACHAVAAPTTHSIPVTRAEEGMYIMDGRIFKIQRAIHGSGYLYAKELVAGGFVYTSGMVRKLNSSHRMTLDQAKRYGALYGVCCVCGIALTNEKSIEAGIGPVCATKF